METFCKATWGVDWHHGSDFVASCSMDSTSKIWDLGSARCRNTLRGHSNAVMSIEFVGKSTTLLTASSDKTVSDLDPLVWSLTSNLDETLGRANRTMSPYLCRASVSVEFGQFREFGNTYCFGWFKRFVEVLGRTRRTSIQRSATWLRNRFLKFLSNSSSKFGGCCSAGRVA